MSTPWRIILREAAKRIGAFRSAASGAAANTDYLTSPLSTTEIDHPVFTLGMIQDTAIDVHGRLALAIANVADPTTGIGCHPWRSFFTGQSQPVASGSPLPTLTVNTLKTIIGALGRPVKNASSQYLQPASIERISRYIEGFAQGSYIGQPLLYCLNGGQVLTTLGATTILFECCGYERADQVTAVAANGNISLPDVLMDGLVAGTVATLAAENELVQLVEIYGVVYKTTLDAIAAGSTAMPGLQMITA